MSKTIVITGGSRGIGAATAKLAGKRGWSVALSYVGNEKAAKETVAAVEAAGGKAIAVKCDHVIEADVIGLFDQATRGFGPIDGVVNNAGIAIAGLRARNDEGGENESKRKRDQRGHLASHRGGSKRSPARGEV